MVTEHPWERVGPARGVDDGPHAVEEPSRREQRDRARPQGPVHGRDERERRPAEQEIERRRHHSRSPRPDERAQHAEAGPGPDHREHGVCARVAEQQAERREGPGDQKEDGGVIEAPHPQVRPWAPVGTVVEGAHREERHQARPVDQRAHPGPRPGSEEHQRDEPGQRHAGGDLVGDPAEQRLRARRGDGVRHGTRLTTARHPRVTGRGYLAGSFNPIPIMARSASALALASFTGSWSETVLRRCFQVA